MRCADLRTCPLLPAVPDFQALCVRRNVTATAEEFTSKAEVLEEDEAMLAMEVEEIRERSAETEYRLREELRGASFYCSSFGRLIVMQVLH